MSTTYFIETYKNNIAILYSLAKIPMQAFWPPKNANLTYTHITLLEVEEATQRKLTEIFRLRTLTIIIEIL